MTLDDDYDAIYHFHGRWIDARGSEMFVIARWVAWGVYAAAFLLTAPLTILAWQASPGAALGLQVGVPPLCAWLLTDAVAGEHTAADWARIGASITRSQTAAHVRRRAAAADQLRYTPTTIIDNIP